MEDLVGATEPEEYRDTQPSALAVVVAQLRLDLELLTIDPMLTLAVELHRLEEILLTLEDNNVTSEGMA